MIFGVKMFGMYGRNKWQYHLFVQPVNWLVALASKSVLHEYEERTELNKKNQRYTEKSEKLR